MIFDTIANAPQYFTLNPHFEAAFRWLQENPNAALGRYEIAGDDCFVMIQNPVGRGKADPLLEAHNEYLDIQITLEGEDEIGWKDRAACSVVKQEYSADNDAALWSEAPEFYLKLAPGTFVILYPQDAHAPVSGEGAMKKAVFKVRV
jgi:YhcH/YjgK/YiaL family protein